MSEPHTADLGTRYRYRREGAELERERIIELLKQAQFRLLGNNDEAMAFAIQELINLINEEQK